MSEHPKTQAKERGILFSAPMVRALLAGTKTQTRRPVKPHPSDDAFCLVDHGDGWWPYRSGDGESPNVDNMEYPINCPYGRVGDRLWVRETWAKPAALDPGPTVYRADYPACVPPGFENLPAVDEITWKPSIHMFRRDSRILLEIVSVRVERLNDCSQADAIAEGIEPNWIGDLATGPNGFGGQGWVPECGWRHYTNGPDGEQAYEAVESYRSLWELISGAGSWAANPWVWVVEFKRVAP